MVQEDSGADRLEGACGLLGLSSALAPNKNAECILATDCELGGKVRVSSRGGVWPYEQRLALKRTVQLRTVSLWLKACKHVEECFLHNLWPMEANGLSTMMAGKKW